MINLTRTGLLLISILFIIECSSSTDPGPTQEETTEDTTDEAAGDSTDDSSDGSTTDPKSVVYQQGTIFLFPDLIKTSDPTTFQELTDTGRGEGTMYDRRTQEWITEDNVFLFDAVFEDDRMVKVLVHPEFENQENAAAVAEKYLPAIGRIPVILHKDLHEVWIMKGNEAFGGGNNSLLIHDDYGDTYIQQGILEETFAHEGTHTSLDDPHASSAGWKSAQEEDSAFISNYARDYTDREDLAESIIPYIAVEYRSDRISDSDYEKIINTISSRIDYLNEQSFDMYPITAGNE